MAKPDLLTVVLNNLAGTEEDTKTASTPGVELEQASESGDTSMGVELGEPKQQQPTTSKLKTPLEQKQPGTGVELEEPKQPEQPISELETTSKQTDLTSRFNSVHSSPVSTPQPVNINKPTDSQLNLEPIKQTISELQQRCNKLEQAPKGINTTTNAVNSSPNYIPKPTNVI